MKLSGIEGSVLENTLFEEDFGVESISTVKLFGIANTNGIGIVELNRDNAMTLLPPLDLPENIKADIVNAVNQDLTVRIPEQEITYESWTGIGYIKENLETGEAGFMLSGMIAGGMTVWSADQWPGDLADEFEFAFSGPPNNDPNAATSIQKMFATDYQEGTVGEPLSESLLVIVRDEAKKPVASAPVTFTAKAGGGKFTNGQSQITVQTDPAGVAYALNSF